MVNALRGNVGSITIIGAVSPQGADFSEPVTQNTKRFVRCFWALDKSLAYVRHYPAINWTDSYSEYADDLKDWYDETLGKEFLQQRQELMSLLHEEDKLMEIVKLIGSDVLPDDQKLIIETGKLIRTGFLQQNAYHADDTYVPLQKQLKMMQVITHLYNSAKQAVTSGLALSEILETGLFYDVAKMKYEIGNDELGKFDDLTKQIDDIVNEAKGGRNND
jgi:V/A-type H+-transporting ATPase subunit A